MMNKLLFKSGSDWTPEIIQNAWNAIEEVAKELKCTYYKPELQIISAHQMMDAYTSVGMPVFYKHWSFGKEFVFTEKQYKAGKMGLALEIVINSDPCIAYLMEENNALQQTMVIAHASIGHSSVFKNNYLFKQYTDASSIVDYLLFAKKYIKKCEEKYGEDEVELILDACHALQTYGTDKYKRPKKLSTVKEESTAFAKFERELNEYDHVWEKTKTKSSKFKIEQKDDNTDNVLLEPQENILYYLEKNSPHLPNWKREIIRINRNISLYFLSQRQTSVLNEGFASFAHFYIMNRLFDLGYIDSGSMMEFLALHGNVIRQVDYQQFNPYKLGFSIFMDIKRICENPTEEDKKFFPNLIGKEWQTEINSAVANFKDETFILQYLSPKVARDLKLFLFRDYGMETDTFQVEDISNDEGFYNLRNKLAKAYALENRMPDIQITEMDATGDRSLTLTHFDKNNTPIDIDDAQRVLDNIAYLWEYDVYLNGLFLDEEIGEINRQIICSEGKFT